MTKIHGALWVFIISMLLVSSSAYADIRCYECHGTKIDDTSGDYRPVDSPYRNISTGGFRGNHSSHLAPPSSAAACAKCHPGSQDYQPGHRNSVISIAFNINSSPLPGEYRNENSRVTLKDQTSTPALGTCSNVNCHFESITPTWGEGRFNLENRCSSCHGAPPVNDRTHTKHHTAYGNTTASCARCHADHENEDAPFAHATSAGKRAVKLVGITYSKLSNVDYPNYLPSQRAVEYRDGSCSNFYCHSNGVGGTPNVTPVWGGTLPTDCTGCHGGNTASFRRLSTGSHRAHIKNNKCGKCHKSTVSEGDDRVITGSANHVDGVKTLDSGSLFYSLSTKSCGNISCHGNTNAVWGNSNGACLDCHSVRQGNRSAITGQFASSSHHVQGGAISNAHCYQCHWEANSDGTINTAHHQGETATDSPIELVVYGEGIRPIVFTEGVSAVRYTANGQRGEIQKINSHCLGCHSDGNNTTEPFGDGRTPKQYAWDGTSVAARYGQTGTTTWGKYSTANGANKRVAKAYSAHGNAAANARGWNTTTGVDGATADTSGGVNVQCYDCHNSHGSTVSGITSRYSSATGKNRGAILKDTTVSGNGYSVAYKPYSGGSTADKNRRSPGASLCLDCHMNRDTQTTPWGYTETYGASQQILGYWDSPFMGYSTAGFEQRYPYKKLKAVKGGHFGASTALNNPAGKAIDGLCTPCHDPHGVSPTMGNNRQYAVPLLKGTFLTSPYKEDTAPAIDEPLTIRSDVGKEGLPYAIDQNTFGSGLINAVDGINLIESQTAGLCLDCHLKDKLTTMATPAVPNPWKSKDRIHETVKGWKSSSATVKHSYSCSKCHSAHTSSALPRLMVTNCLDSGHKGRSGWANAKVAGSGSGQIIAYPGGYCSEIPYSFRIDGASNISGGSGWCMSNYMIRGSGSGTGRIPGSWRGDVPGFGNNSVACHEGQTGSGTDQSWNTVTPWEIYPPMTISPPSATVNGLQANINWPTNIPGSSTINYGLTSEYGSTATGPSSVLSHSVNLINLLNHNNYHYKAESLAKDGQRVFSSDYIFYVSVPPSVPTIIAKSSSYCASSCQQTLQWNPVDDPDNGPVEYQVQVDTSDTFNSGNIQTSPWIPAPTTSWAVTLSSNNNWYWRVQARDANHTTPQDPASGWSATGSFSISSSVPAAPVIGTPTALSTTAIRWNFTDNSINEDGFRLHDATDTVKASASIISYLEETGLVANTQYTRHVHAYNGGGESLASESVSRYTLSVTPNVTFVQKSPAVSVTPPAGINASGMTPTNAAGFGAGGVKYYRTRWDQNPTYSFGSYSYWGTPGSLILIPSTEGAWYFHVQSRNGDEIINGQVDYGPFYYDVTPPTVTSFAAITPWTANLNIPITAFSASDAVSGITGYMITTSATPPLNSATGWSSSLPTFFTAPAPGTYTLYPWVKDFVGNISAAFASPPVVQVTDTTPPAGVGNDSPINGLADVSIRSSVMSLTASDNFPGSIQYFFQVALDSAFSAGLQQSGWQSGSSYLPTLAPGTSYYWRVKARDASLNETGFTNSWSFTTSLHSVVWTTKGDFETNAGTTGTATSRNLVAVSGTNASSDSTVSARVMSLVSGKYHSLALKGDGTVWAWGQNSDGRLGDGTTVQRNVPVQVQGGLSGVISVAAGVNHSLAVKSDGTVRAWGYNGGGQLGDTTTTQRLLPVQVSGLNGAISVAAGSSHSLALKSDGTVWAWGNNGNGQLGINSTNTAYQPVQVAGVTGVAALTAGSYHSLAVKSDGTVWAWGNNSNGQLGDNSTTQRIAPVQIPGLSGITAVAGGDTHSLALKSDGTVWAWGSNNYGQLGDGSNTQRVVPVQVTGLTGVVSVSAGNYHSLALKSDGTVWAWGYNAVGQLGNGTLVESRVPVQVGTGGNGAVAITAGSAYSLALKGDGTVWGWGGDYDGQLGIGGGTTVSTPSRMLGSNTYTVIEGGQGFAVGLANDGTVWAWGYNGNGAFGNGSTESSDVPVQVPGLSGIVGISSGTFKTLAITSSGDLLSWGGSQSGVPTVPAPVTDIRGFIAVAQGSAFSLALKNDGTVWSWGSNNAGQLGDGTTTTRVAPVQVTGLSGVIAIAAGMDHSLALTSDGKVWAWGNNTYGQLGDGTIANRSIPVLVTGLTNIVKIACGSDHSLALKNNGTVWAWGVNNVGQLGDGTTTNRTGPVQVADLTGVTALSAYGHSLALKSDGTLWAWGPNSYGQIGDGTTTNRTAPVQVGGLSAIAIIGTGNLFSFAANSEGATWSFGNNGDGAIGNGKGSQQKLPRQSMMSGMTVQSGTVTGLKYNAGAPVNWGRISWNGSTPGRSAILLRTRGADNEAGLAAAGWNDHVLSHSKIAPDTSQFLEIEMRLMPDGSMSPRVDDLSVTFTSP